MKTLRAVKKFLKGKGTIYCAKCNVAIRENLTKKQMKYDIQTIYCDTCAKEELNKFINDYYKNYSVKSKINA